MTVKELTQRLGEARTERASRQNQINNYLRFADPTAPRIGDSLHKPQDRSDEADDRFDTTLNEVAEDFAADLIARVMPRQSNWLAFEPNEQLPKEVRKQLEEPLRLRTATIFDAIRASNFYDDAAPNWALDQGHGTACLQVTDPGSGQEFLFEHIPVNQLLILRGERGPKLIAREFMWELAEALAYWPGYNWPERLKAEARRTTGQCRRINTVLAATRIADPGGERWRWQVLVDGKHLIHEEELTGRGSCPFILSRWRTHSASAWGVGPLLKSVPDAMTLDQERYLILKNLGFAVDPVTMYDHDGVINVDGGVAPGDWIARRAGSKIDRLDPGNLSPAYYEQGHLQDNIRRAGFQSGPRQRGKTPPTLGQWMDEKAEEGRRLEMPTGKLYTEAVIAIVSRVERLLLDRGEIDETLSVGEKVITLKPLNPLSRQQDYEQVQNAQALLREYSTITGPQVLAAEVDTRATFENMKARLQDTLIEMRPEEQADPYLQAVLGQPGTSAGLEEPMPEG
ncbi:MAG: portal protein [Brevundimonas sp.]|uniref:portal protein n=1 Tax=Brevundimonas sp. TaxID=1871086 RepID=UPI003919C717